MLLLQVVQQTLKHDKDSRKHVLTSEVAKKRR